MVMAVNNAPLLGQLADFSNLKSDFDKGQQIRNAWDNRQASKAMNGLLAIDDYNERLNQARKHRLAGLLVPKVQEYEEARQKASLSNLKTSSDIQKTYADIGKTGAETTEINAKSADKVQSLLAKAGLTGNKKIFNNMLYDFYNRGLMDKEQVGSWLRLGETGDRATFQQLAMGDTDIAKTFKPSLETTDLGNRVAINEYNPLSGDFNSLGEYNKGQSPDNYANNQAKMYGYDMGYKGKVYSADRSLEGKKFDAEYDYQKAQLQANKLQTKSINGMMWLFNPATGKYQRMVDENGKQLIDTKGRSGNKPKPAQILKMENEFISTINDTQNTASQLQQWINNLDLANVDDNNKADKLELGLIDNTLNSAGNWLGITSDSGKKFAEFNSFIKDLASKALRLNAGVQTDSDYKRQLEALISGEYIPRDNATATTLLKKMQNDFAVVENSAKSGLANIRSEWGGAMPNNYQGGSNTQAQQPTQPTTSKKQQQFGNIALNRLGSGY